MISYWIPSDLSAPDERATPGGSCTLYAVRRQDVLSMPSHIPGQATMDPLLIQNGTQFYTYRLDADSIRFTESTEDSRQGSLSRISLSGFRTEISIEHQTELEKLRPGYYIVLWEDALGRRRLLGTPDRPMLFTYSSDSGATDQDETGATWRFDGIQVGYSCYLSEILPIPQVITTQCGVLSMSDFNMPGWYVVNDVFSGIEFVPNPLGNIASIDGYPTGGLANISQGFGVGPIYYNASLQRYEPLSPTTLQPGLHRITIPNIPVTLTGSGASCSITFLSEFTVEGGAFSSAYSTAYD